MRTSTLCLLGLSLAFSACLPTTQQPTVTETQLTGITPSEASPTAEAVTPRSGASVPPAPVPVDIPGGAGLTLRGIFYGQPAGPVPGVLLLHMYGHTKEDWDGVARQMQGAGMVCLAIDLRGHGETGGTEDWDLAKEDAHLAFDWLVSEGGADPNHSGVVGASIGANLALWLGAEESQVAAIALLSPGFEYFRVRIEGLIARLGLRPIFLAASEEDAYSADTVRDLAEAAAGQVDLVIYQDAGHGTGMFDSAPDLADRLLAFLETHLAP